MADILGGFRVQVTLLSIIPEPEEDFFDTAEEQAAWTRKDLEAPRPCWRTTDGSESGRVPSGQDRIRACVGRPRSLPTLFWRRSGA